MTTTNIIDFETRGSAIIAARQVYYPGPAISLDEQRAHAMDALRIVYNKGPHGRAIVAALCRKYRVKRLADVPAERTAEFLADADAADMEEYNTRRQLERAQGREIG